MRENPFESPEVVDITLIQKSLSGSTQALESLIKRHQDFIYNVALKMTLNPQDAEDLTQESLIKIVTNLSKFQSKSSFRTWAYRIVVNHFLNVKKKNAEKVITTFENYGKTLDETPDSVMTKEEQITKEDSIREAKVGCMSAMLLCLDREQRLIFVMGEIFQIGQVAGAEIFNLSKENFRKKLSRARKDLYAFMDNKCGLINKANPCRCHLKTKAFVQRGWVNEETLQFSNKRLTKINKVVLGKQEDLENEVVQGYLPLYRDHPFHRKEIATEVGKTIMSDPKIRKIFNLES